MLSPVLKSTTPTDTEMFAHIAPVCRRPLSSACSEASPANFSDATFFDATPHMYNAHIASRISAPEADMSKRDGEEPTGVSYSHLARNAPLYVSCYSCGDLLRLLHDAISMWYDIEEQI
jgi:hypothetical protein